MSSVYLGYNAVMARQMCQSCGQPLKDSNKGTESDGSQSSDYCKLCYVKGTFVDPNITLEEMQQICIKAMRDMHFPRFLAKNVANKQIPKLKRWNKTTKL